MMSVLAGSASNLPDTETVGIYDPTSSQVHYRGPAALEASVVDVIGPLQV